MATVAISALSAGTVIAAGDFFVYVDISDSTQAPSGTTKSLTETVLFAGITVPLNVTSASATSFAVGRLGATTPAFTVDSSTASQVAGFKVTGAATGGTVALVVTDSGSNANLSINAKGSGTIAIGSVSTGAVTITPALTLASATANPFILNGATTGLSYGQVANTGGISLWGVNNSTGAGVTGGSAYAAFFGSNNATAAEIITNGVVRLSIASGGAATFTGALAITGALSGVTTLAASTAVLLGATPASAGAVRLSNATFINGRNAANSGDVGLIGMVSDTVSIGAGATSIDMAVRVGLFGAATAGSGSDVYLGGTTQGTIGANGAASALTANPLGYLIAYVGSTKIVIPYYNG